SPWARHNYVDHSLTNQASIVRFIEDNWGLGQIGGASADAWSNSLSSMFDFRSGDRGDSSRLSLDPATGTEAG
ncbi:MAG: phospholipase, partial [Candidatus Dormibacteraeota bacterium]|nr:phospholipase [Candidatus Dormibacteraeota bacterium]